MFNILDGLYVGSIKVGSVNKKNCVCVFSAIEKQNKICSFQSAAVSRERAQLALISRLLEM